MVSLTEDQERLLSQHAAARGQTPAEALQTLLESPLPARKRWSEQDLILLRNPANSPRSLSLILKRSPSAISVRRHQLAKEENRPELMRKTRNPNE